MKKCDSNTPPSDWLTKRFAGHCAFYPDRDCPGWNTGEICARIGEEINQNGGGVGDENGPPDN